MTQNIETIKNQIVQKNIALALISKCNRHQDRGKEQIHSLQSELDSLLYQYYRLIIEHAKVI